MYNIDFDLFIVFISKIKEIIRAQDFRNGFPSSILSISAMNIKMLLHLLFSWSYPKLLKAIEVMSANHILLCNKKKNFISSITKFEILCYCTRTTALCSLSFTSFLLSCLFFLSFVIFMTLYVVV